MPALFSALQNCPTEPSPSHSPRALAREWDDLGPVPGWRTLSRSGYSIVQCAALNAHKLERPLKLTPLASRGECLAICGFCLWTVIHGFEQQTKVQLSTFANCWFGFKKFEVLVRKEQPWNILVWGSSQKVSPLLWYCGGQMTPNIPYLGLGIRNGLKSNMPSTKYKQHLAV